MPYKRSSSSVMVKVRSSAQPLTIKATVSSHSLISFSCTRQRKWHDPDVQPQLWFYKPCQTCPICSRLLRCEQALHHRLLHASTHLHAAFRVRTISTLATAFLWCFFHLALWFHCHFIAPFYHFTLLAQYAADILPLAIFLACRALNDFRRAASDFDSPCLFGLPETPC